MQYLTALLNTPGVGIGGGSRGMAQIGPPPEGLDRAGRTASTFGLAPEGLLDTAWAAARGAGTAAGPERPTVPLGTAAGRDISFDPYMSIPAVEERSRRRQQTTSTIEAALEELSQREAYEALLEDELVTPGFNEGLDYVAMQQKAIESGITEKRQMGVAEYEEELRRTRPDEVGEEKRRIETEVKRIKNDAFLAFQADPALTVSQFIEGLPPDEAEIMSLPDLQKVWKDVRALGTKDDTAETLRRGLYKTLGAPGSRTWTPPDSTDLVTIEPQVHESVIKSLTEPVPGTGRPATLQEVREANERARDERRITEFQYEMIKEILRPLKEQDDTITLADGTVITIK
jgi:hypothetical protein